MILMSFEDYNIRVSAVAGQRKHSGYMHELGLRIYLQKDIYRTRGTFYCNGNLSAIMD